MRGEARGYPWSECQVCGETFDASRTYSTDFSVCRECAEAIVRTKEYEEPGPSRCAICDKEKPLDGDGSFGEEFGICEDCATDVTQFYIAAKGVH